MQHLLALVYEALKEKIMADFIPPMVQQQPQVPSLTPESIRRNIGVSRMRNIEIPSDLSQEEKLSWWQKIKKAASEGFFGTEGKHFLSPLYTEPQMQAFDTARSMGLQQLQNPYQGFDPIEKYAQYKFHTQTVPTIAERFTAMGDSAQRSSGFTSALGSASTELGLGLAALRAQYGLQQQGLAQNLLGLGQTSQYQPIYKAGKPGFLRNVAEPLTKGLIQTGASYLSSGAV